MKRRGNVDRVTNIHANATNTSAGCLWIKVKKRLLKRKSTNTHILHTLTAESVVEFGIRNKRLSSFGPIHSNFPVFQKSNKEFAQEITEQRNLDKNQINTSKYKFSALFELNEK